MSFTTNGTTTLGLSFFITVIFVSALGFDIPSSDFKLLGAGLIWSTTLLSVLISAKNIIQDDFKDGSLDLLLVSPIPLELVLSIKALAHWIAIGWPIILISPVFSVIFNFSSENLYILIIGLFFGTPALSFIAVFGASLTFSLKRSGILMPVIIMPLYIPTLVFGIKIVNFTPSKDDYSVSGILILISITLLSIAIVPFAASIGVRSSLK